MLRLFTPITLGLLAALPALAQEAPYRVPEVPYRMMYGWHGGWGGMIIWPLFMFLICIAVMVWMMRGHTAPPPPYHRRDPIDILKDRFARGEIDKEEFEERRKILER
jgi:uncharacterized membrane protein